MGGRQDWVCSPCGRPFSRHWNAKRHMAQKHPEDGEIIPHEEYHRRLYAGKMPLPSNACGHRAFDRVMTRKTLLAEIDERAYLTAKKVAETVHAGTNSAVHLNVCKDCLSLAVTIDIYGKSLTAPACEERVNLHETECDPGWLLDYPMVADQHIWDITVKHLEAQIPTLLKMILRPSAGENANTASHPSQFHLLTHNHNTLSFIESALIANLQKEYSEMPEEGRKLVDSITGKEGVKPFDEDEYAFIDQKSHIWVTKGARFVGKLIPITDREFMDFARIAKGNVGKFKFNDRGFLHFCTFVVI